MKMDDLSGILILCLPGGLCSLWVGPAWHLLHWMDHAEQPGVLGMPWQWLEQRAGLGSEAP